VINDFLGSPAASPWHEAARQSGFAASVSIPIRFQGQVAGALMAYASEKDFLGTEEIKLLEEAAGDVAFALDTLELAAQHKLDVERLKEREFFFRESQRAAAIGSYKTDFLEGRWESSEVLDSIFGIPQSYDRTIPGWLEIIHPDDQAMMAQYLYREVIAKRKPFAKEYRIRRPNDGMTRWVHGRGEIAFGDDGRAVSLIGTIQDITERKLAEETLREQEARYRTQFRLREIHWNDLLREEADLLERTTMSRIRLELSLAEDLGLMRGDASALTHAVMNLCVNAVDAMPDGGTLALRTRNVDGVWIEVLVEDTGTGMPSEVLEKAVDPFFTTKGVGKGTGLGLSMVYSTVKAHQGQLEIQSEPGQGTRVSMRFPTCEPSALILGPGEAQGPSKASPAGLRVLVVDDDELIRSSTQAILAALGHQAHTASSGEAALRELEGGLQPGVVILDMNMPGLGGAGTLPRLRALCPEVPVLLSPGRIDQMALDLAALHPGVTLLSKPFTMGELQHQLESLAPD